MEISNYIQIKKKLPLNVNLLAVSKGFSSKEIKIINKVNKKNDFSQPNKFLGKRKDLTPEKMLKFVKKFKDSGATILGGCCETTPAHIKLFASIR